MADNSIVGGLFGVDPSMYQMQQQATQEAQAMKFAQLDPMQQAQYGAFRGGQQLGNVGANLMGMQDPMLAKATQLKQIASQYNYTTPEGLKQMAQALMQAGYPEQAQMAISRSNELVKAGLEQQKTVSEIGKNMGSNQTEVMKTQGMIAQLKQQGDPQGQIPALEDRLRSLVKSDIPASVYNSVIAPQSEKFNVATQNKSELDRLTGMIDNGILKFGVTENFRNKLKTVAGESTEGSRAAADFASTLESIRLQAQILQKGSQTDRDAANIMNSFLSNVDKYDTNTVKTQLARISKLMENQAKNAQGLIKQTEDYYGGSSGRSPAFAGTESPSGGGAATPNKTYYSKATLDAVRAKNPSVKDLSDADLAARIDASKK
jgi:hypothetical protein